MEKIKSKVEQVKKKKVKKEKIKKEKKWIFIPSAVCNARSFKSSK